MADHKVKVPRAIYLVVASVLILSGMAQWLFLKYGNQDNNAPYRDDGISATILYDASAIPPFQLSNHKGETFNQDNLIGHWSMLSFGYTHCPDICPTTLHTLNQVDEILRAMNYAILPQTVFISLDPERDDIATLAEYIPWFNKDFIGITGSAEQIAVLTKNLGIYNQKRAAETGTEDYLIDHTVTIMLIDTEGRLRALTSAPHVAQTIADDFIKITRKFAPAL